MDKSRFTTAATGSLIQIGKSDSDWAFVPNPLPADWTFPEKLWPLLAEARERLGTLNGIGRTLPNPQLLLQPLQQLESLRSSSLEGTYATPEELLLFGKQPREPKSEADPANAWKEVWNYGAALREGMRLLNERPLSNVTIKAMHEQLMAGVRGREKSPGEFRREQVWIGSDRRYIPPPASHVQDLMFNLQDYINTGRDLDPLVRSYIVHYQFEAIHPFLDGNGRVGRALLALMVKLLHEHHMPWLYMSAYFERYRDEYVDNMFNISAEGDWDTWMEFCLRGTIEQAADAIARCDALKCLQEQYRSKLDMKRARIHQIIDDLFTSPVVTKPQLQEQLGVAYKTASSDVEYLVEQGVLSLLPDSSHPRVYYAKEIISIAFGERTTPPSSAP